MLTDYQIGEVYLAWDAKPGTRMADFARAIEVEVGKELAAGISKMELPRTGKEYEAGYNRAIEVTQKFILRTRPAPGGEG